MCWMYLFDLLDLFLFNYFLIKKIYFFILFIYILYLNYFSLFKLLDLVV